MAQTEPNKIPQTRSNSSSLLPLVAIVIVIFSYFAASLVGELSLFGYGFIRGWSIDQISLWIEDSTVAKFLSYAFVYGLMVLAIYLFARGNKMSMASLGLVRPRLRDPLFGAAAFPVYFGTLLLATIVLGFLVPSLNLEQEQQIGFEQSGQQLEMLMIFASLVILPPLVEEFVMRGFLFTSLLKRHKFLTATIMTSALFGVAHLQLGTGAPPLWIAGVDTFILSVAACYLRFYTGSLWPAIFLHFFKNLMAFLFIFVFHVV